MMLNKNILIMRYMLVILFSVFLSNLSLMSKEMDDSLKHVLCPIVENGLCCGSIDSMFFYDDSLNTYIKVNDYAINKDGFDVKEETYSNMLRSDSIILYVKYVDTNFSRKKDLEVSIPILFSNSAFMNQLEITLKRDDPCIFFKNYSHRKRSKEYCLQIDLHYHRTSCSLNINFILHSEEIKSGKVSKVIKTVFSH